MHALKEKWLGKRRNAATPDAIGAAEPGVVLPRFLRKPARLLTALVDGRVAIPPHTGTRAAAALFVLTGLYGVVEGGHFRALMETVTAATGFAVERVDVAGNIETSPIDVVQRLGLDGGTSTVTLDVDAARAAIMTLPWVANAQVRKIYPDVVDVKLTERRAFAIWQHGQELSLIERNGNVIAPFANDGYMRLPLFVGLGADRHARDFDRLLETWPALKERVKASIRVANRRWDIRLDNGVTVRLPESGAARALDKLRRFDAEQGLLERDIETVDLRLDDRITVGLTEGATERRNTAVSDRAKMLKKRGRNS